MGSNTFPAGSGVSELSKPDRNILEAISYKKIVEKCDFSQIAAWGSHTSARCLWIPVVIAKGTLHGHN